MILVLRSGVRNNSPAQPSIGCGSAPSRHSLAETPENELSRDTLITIRSSFLQASGAIEATLRRTHQMETRRHPM